VPNYKLRDNTPEMEVEQALSLGDDGTFSMWLAVWDFMASGSGVYAEGRWTRAGDTITFEVMERGVSYWNPLTTATVVGDALDVAGFGTFSAD
jgi:hypothetical protein